MQEAEPLTLTQSEVARLRGITVQAFKRWADQWGLVGEKVGREVHYSGPDIIAAAVRQGEANAAPAPVLLTDENGEEIDVDLERARKLKAERIGQEIKNAEAVGELAPIDLMRSVLRDALQTANSWLDSVPAQIKRVAPEVSGSTLDVIERECAKVRNSIADGRIKYSDERMASYSREPGFGGSG